MKHFDDIRFQELKEGLYDPGIFKAFFLAGGPGSGKTFVTTSAFAGSGLKVVNSDTVFERSLKKSNLSLSMPDEEAYFRDIVRKSAKATAGNMLDTYVAGRLGLVIDATGRDYNIIHNQASMLKQLGYDTYMIFVNTSLEVALERQKKRERQVPEYIVKKSWDGVQSNIGRFQQLFGMSNFIVVDNNRSEQELVTQTMSQVSRTVRRLLNTPIKSYIAKRWMAKERAARRR
jgi:predicted kinase